MTKQVTAEFELVSCFGQIEDLDKQMSSLIKQQEHLYMKVAELRDKVMEEAVNSDRYISLCWLSEMATSSTEGGVSAPAKFYLTDSLVVKAWVDCVNYELCLVTEDKDVLLRVVHKQSDIAKVFQALSLSYKDQK